MGNEIDGILEYRMELVQDTGRFVLFRSVLGRANLQSYICKLNSAPQ